MNRNVAMTAVRAAARLRADFGIGPTDAVCPYDIAARLGIRVQFARLASLEGVYAPGEFPTILIGAERPSGRRRFTAAHEIGHHVLGHGERLDEIRGDGSTQSAEEFAADRFAAALLMPKLAIEAAFARRRYSIHSMAPDDVFIVAQDLGVGFTTLITHLECTLRVLAKPAAEALRSTTLPDIRARLAGNTVPHDLIVVNNHWGARPVDMEIGDSLLIPSDAHFEGSCLVLAESKVARLVTTHPGSGSITVSRNRPPIEVRVMRRNFEGLSQYRFLEEETHED